ncbi:glycosyltransferase family 2 protein [Niabella beijingensis]|uniref:glycosyltransferase family 2 protein n=1 Tax=Niabella beijingensis TaxID=2872700 RepID=UPI001CBADC44|nr:glycosyltransferase family 2 protein [Niabella beijingensis]MBZ4191095.1 glycosyltransferase [Niabella beijingensis]
MIKKEYICSFTISMRPLISICIPSYENVALVKRLLDSIVSQTFKDYEVIITDDSRSNAVEILSHTYKSSIPGLTYFKNAEPLGSPANWNKAIRQANGQWIKLMHHDDFFTRPDALALFAQKTQEPLSGDFIFSNYISFSAYAETPHRVTSLETILLRKSPLNLFKRNFIGPPSTTLIRNNNTSWYDERVKWVVDFEFYINYLSTTTFTYIAESLIGIGVHEAQITASVFRKKGTEIPENFYLLEKLGARILSNIFVYDYYWRSFRNLKIRSIADLAPYTTIETIPKKMLRLMKFQFAIPLSVLKIGPISKCLMAFSYCFR